MALPFIETFQRRPSKGGLTDGGTERGTLGVSMSPPPDRLSPPLSKA